MNPPPTIAALTQLEFVGAGGSGRVYRAWEAAFDRWVAVKVVEADGPDRLAAFYEECRLWGMVADHPHIVSVHRYGTTAEGAPFLMMEFCPGRSLADRVASEGVLSVPLVVRTGSSLASALAAAHATGVFHRDVKPANILVTQYGEPALTDFGIAEIAGADRLVGRAHSVLHAAPETLRGAEPSATADIYSLAATLFELLDGLPPHADPDDHTVDAHRAIERVLHDAPRSPRRRDLPDPLVELLRRALSADPERRPATALAFATELEDCLDSPDRGRPRSTATASDLGLFGRESEFEALCELVASERERVVTVTGPGGVGKTALVLSVAAAVAEQFVDGVVMVALADISELSDVAPAVADAANVPLQAMESPEAAVVRALRERHSLVILDNAEHLLPVELTAAIRRECPSVTVLVTSRRPLQIQSEREFRLDPLRVPGRDVSEIDLADEPAVRLFVERARAVDPGLVVDVENTREIAAIVRRLDGIPLAIELAAARVRILSPAEIVERLDRRASLLESVRVDVSPRQQTLNRTIAWSVDLLRSEERDLFLALAVFRGSASLEAIERVVGDPDGELLSRLESLVTQNLVIATRDAEGKRFRLLETIREFAEHELEQRGASDTWGVRHARFFLAEVDRLTALLGGPEQQRALGALDLEAENVRAALRWARRFPDRAPLLDGVDALVPYWLARGLFHEGRAWLDDDLPTDTAAGARMLWARAYFAQQMGDLAAAAASYEAAIGSARRVGALGAEALARCGLSMVPDLVGDRADESLQGFAEAVDLARAQGDDSVLATILRLRGTYCLRRHLIELGAESYGESYAIFTKRGDLRNAAIALRGLANVAHYQADDRRARLLAERGLEYSEHLGDPVGANAAEILLGELDRDGGELPKARAVNERILARAHQLGHARLYMAASLNLGFICLDLDDVAAACRHFRAAQERAERADDRSYLAVSVGGLACVALALGNEALAATLFRSMDHSIETTGLTIEPTDAAVIARWRARLAAEAGVNAPALSVDDALALAHRYLDLELSIRSALA
jgi:non-specific serine/threonine protein kinase